MKDLTPLEAGRWMAAAPQIVQDAVTNAATEQTLNQISKQYNLHVDVAGLLEKLTRYMLIGYTSPEEFLRELLSARVADKDARQIMTDINQKIFVPLRAKMMDSNTATIPPKPAVPTAMTSKPEIPAVRPQSTMPVVPPKPVMPIVSPAPKTEVPNQAGSYFHLENKIPVTPAPKPAMPFPPRPAQGNLPPKAFLPRPAMLGAMTALPANRMLEDHEEPSPSLKSVTPITPVAPILTPVASAPVAPRPPVAPSRVEPAIPAVEIPTPPILPKVAMPLSPAAPAPLPVPSPAPAQAKPHDPYREPIDEPVSRT